MLPHIDYAPFPAVRETKQHRDQTFAEGMTDSYCKRARSCGVQHRAPMHDLRRTWELHNNARVCTQICRAHSSEMRGGTARMSWPSREYTSEGRCAHVAMQLAASKAWCVNTVTGITRRMHLLAPHRTHPLPRHTSRSLALLHMTPAAATACTAQKRERSKEERAGRPSKQARHREIQTTIAIIIETKFR